MKVGVIVGRFQAPHLHAGHKHLIDTVILESDKVVLFIGSSDKKFTNRNPLSFPMRKNMIRSSYPFVEIYPIIDVPSDKEWVDNLDNMIPLVLDENDTAILFGSRDSFIPMYKEHSSVNLECRVIDEIVDVSASINREEVVIENNISFRNGVIFVTQNMKEVSIDSLEYGRLRDADALLQCLQECGVDNWSGYGDAMEEFNKLKNEKDS